MNTIDEGLLAAFTPKLLTKKRGSNKDELSFILAVFTPPKALEQDFLSVSCKLNPVLKLTGMVKPRIAMTKNEMCQLKLVGLNATAEIFSNSHVPLNTVRDVIKSTGMTLNTLVSLIARDRVSTLVSLKNSLTQ
jgi:hypothetical protein